MKPELELPSHSSIWGIAVKWLLGVIAVIGFVVTIYLGFIKKTSPIFEYDILSETDFFNNRESASYIKIFIDSTDVQENHLNISTYRIQISNKGNDNISYYDYDTGLFGLKIVDGTLLEPPVLLESSTDYIKTKFSNDSIIKTSFINIPKLAIDVDDYFIIKLVILHEVDVSPSFIPIGKISGQKDIAVNPIQLPQPNFWMTSFSGNILVQSVRLVAYLIAAIIVLLLVVLIVSLFSDIVKKNKRQRFIRELQGNKSISNIVKETYINYDASRIVELQKVFQCSETEITERYKATNYFINHRSHKKSSRLDIDIIHQAELYRQMLEDGYMFVNSEGIISFNREAMASVKKILDLLKDRGLLEK